MGEPLKLASLHNNDTNVENPASNHFVGTLGSGIHPLLASTIE
jgi:hypothetical protein